MTKETAIRTGRNLSRRGLLGGAAATGLLAAPNIARAAPTELVIGTNGGEEYRQVYKAVYGPFEQKYNAKIVPVFADGATLLNRVIAEKSSPTLDATVAYQGAWLVGKAEGVFEKLNYANIPNIDDVYDFIRDPEGYGPFTSFGAWGIVYNRDTVKKPPTSFKALWSPDYAGKILIGGIYHWQIHLAAFAHAWTGDQSKVDVAFDKVKELAPRLAGFYGLTSDAQSKFQQGLGDIATWYSFTAQRLRNINIPMAFQTPEEGAFIYPSNFQAVKGTKKLDLVEKLIGQFYEPQSCVAMAELDGQIPANRKVKLDVALQKEILTNEEVLKAHNWDWAMINAQQNAWLTRWNAEIRPLVHG
ncbi:MAG: ABC transporter substrate-binding protein [Hyphomicrobiales bacterium]